jgi:hypothetical protein
MRAHLKSVIARWIWVMVLAGAAFASAVWSAVEGLNSHPQAQQWWENVAILLAIGAVGFLVWNIVWHVRRWVWTRRNS